MSCFLDNRQEMESKPETPQENHTMEELHSISQGFHIIDGYLHNLTAKINFLQSVEEDLNKIQRLPPTRTPMSESLSFLDSRAKLMKDWTESCSKRVSVRIGLFYQNTNLWVANLTKLVSESAQKDSSSMITFVHCSLSVHSAHKVSLEWPLLRLFSFPDPLLLWVTSFDDDLVTNLSLTSQALFSTQFFSINSATRRLNVEPQVWIYVFITVPLTLACFFIWAIWKKRRNRQRQKRMPITKMV